MNAITNPGSALAAQPLRPRALSSRLGARHPHRRGRHQHEQAERAHELRQARDRDRVRRIELLRVDQRRADHLRGVLDRGAEEHRGRGHVGAEERVRDPRIRHHRRRAEQHDAGDRDADVLLARLHQRRDGDDRRAAADRRAGRQQPPDAGRDAEQPARARRPRCSATEMQATTTGNATKLTPASSASVSRRPISAMPIRSSRRLANSMPGLRPGADAREVPPQDAGEDREQDRADLRRRSRASRPSPRARARRRRRGREAIVRSALARGA